MQKKIKDKRLEKLEGEEERRGGNYSQISWLSTSTKWPLHSGAINDHSITGILHEGGFAERVHE